ncbi:fungal hydrophobin domain-containing [Fusarium sporotrichioides]|uniref:Hydrophobin n=1 Tax=Fusarium sporotrichioides TaxID=5514 RepID=A0A395SUU7_FUSSP|nr:fungal hydrophobin domain-containing [Fusarium sporotrichioides]
MHFMTIITIFTSATAAARSKGQRKQNVNELRVSDAEATCGDGFTVQCCNITTDNGGNKNNIGGLLGLGLLSDSNIFNDCADLNLNIVGLLDGPLKGKCSANVACCQENPYNLVLWF